MEDKLIWKQSDEKYDVTRELQEGDGTELRRICDHKGIIWFTARRNYIHSYETDQWKFRDKETDEEGDCEEPIYERLFIPR
jgi:hypothetical protein